MEPTTRQRIQDWMLRLAEGDRSAFEPLFETLWPVLESFARRFLGNAEEARDAAQEALLRVFSRASEFDRQRDAVNWILGIAVYQCRTLRQRRKRRLETDLGEEDLEAIAGLDKSAEDSLVEESLLAAARGVLGTLKPMDVETIRIALHGDGRPKVTGAAFRKRLQRALERLRVAWRMKYGSP
jgi:RNA polymerase sigma-70 factor (ECF subfamily)